MVLVVLAPRPGGQGDAPLPSPAARRVAILVAEDRRAPTAGDLATIRAGVHSGDATTERIALRALGRLERPELIADIVPGLRHPLPEVRAEAANAIGQAAQGWNHKPPSKVPTRAELDGAAAALAAQLSVEADQTVRAAIGESLGRLPYVTADQVAKATRTLLGLMARSQSPSDRLGVAKGMEAIARLQRLSPLDTDVAGALRTLSTPSPAPGSVETARGTVRSPAGGAADPARGARVRRLAWQALIDAEGADDAVIRGSAADPDAQVRRLVMRAASDPRFRSSDVAADVLRRGLTDASPMVRLEALLALPDHDVEAGPRSGARPDTCLSAMDATGDPDPHVALAGLDRLAACPSAEAAAMLERTISDLPEAGAERGWHRAAHAIVALASSSPERAAATLRQFADSRNSHLRIYAARAAAVLKDRGTLERLATDDDDNVKEAAIDGLRAIAGHGADGLYLAALATGRYQVLRAAAAALAGTEAPDAVPVLGAALHRLVVEGRDNSRDARRAIAETLQGLGVAVDAGRPARAAGSLPGLVAADLRRLAAARARVTIRGVGTFELALIASEAPMSVLRFVRLVESGYYNGLTFHRVAPNFVIQGGSPGANEYVGDTMYMRDEVGQWPHVRGAVGISTRGRDTGDAQIFVDLVDNPRLDHEYTVFAQVLNGMEIVDAILEGDVIERIDIVGRP
jgi:cyclophilin family peptidyl-prolyl cis-trans isomerase